MTLWWTTLAWADPAAVVDEARSAVRAGQIDEARALIRELVQSPDGRQSGEGWWLLAQLAVQRADLDEALRAADRAFVHAPDDAARTAAEALLVWLNDRFGTLHITSKAEASYLLKEAEPYFETELREWSATAVAAVQQPSPGPRRVGLPAGTWTLDGQSLVVAPGEVTEVSGGGSAWRDLGLGVGASVIGGGPTFAAAHLHVRWDAPVGTFRVGLEAAGGPHLFPTWEGALVATSGRVGATGHALVGDGTRPMRLGLRAGMGRAPGTPLTCREGTCGPDVDVPDLALWATRTDAYLHVDVGFDQTSSRAARTWGVSVVPFAGAALGWVDRQGSATRLDGAGATSWVADAPATFSAEAGLSLTVFFRP